MSTIYWYHKGGTLVLGVFWPCRRYHAKINIDLILVCQMNLMATDKSQVLIIQFLAHLSLPFCQALSIGINHSSSNCQILISLNCILWWWWCHWSFFHPWRVAWPRWRRMPCGCREACLGITLKHYQTCTDILVNSFTDDLMLPFKMVHTVLLVREPSTTLRAHKGVFFSTLIL